MRFELKTKMEKQPEFY